MIGNFPDHPFMGMGDADPDDPDAVCYDMFQTMHEDDNKHGYAMTAQCGHTRSEHKS